MIKKALFVLALASAFSVAHAAKGNPAAGKEKAAAICASCHGADGNSPTADFPKLAGQHADYLEAALHQYKAGKRKNPIMAGFAANLSDQDMADLAAYFSSQQGLTIKY
jgi:cytochrome c553